MKKVYPERSRMGFTLIEVLIAAFLLVLVTGAAVLVENQNIKSGSINKHQLEALGLAQEGIETAKHPDFPTTPGTYCLIRNGQSYSWQNFATDPTRCEITGDDGRVFTRRIVVE